MRKQSGRQTRKNIIRKAAHYSGSINLYVFTIQAYNIRANTTRGIVGDASEAGFGDITFSQPEPVENSIILYFRQFSMLCILRIKPAKRITYFRLELLDNPNCQPILYFLLFFSALYRSHRPREATNTLQADFA